MGREARLRVGAPRSLRLLLVDDYPANVLAMGVALRPLGADIVEAFSARQAIASSEQEEFDGILMDVRLPDLSGLEACARIRCGVRNRSTPVLFHSAEDLSLEERRCAALHSAIEVLRKPVEPERLLDEMRALLAQPTH
jgi:CheY-like chemotaxis protein